VQFIVLVLLAVLWKIMFPDELRALLLGKPFILRSTAGTGSPL